MPYAFTATHGVKFSEDGKKVWARFELDSTSTVLVDGVTVKVYRFETTDAKIAARLRKVNAYGITEVKADSNAKSADADTGDGNDDATGDTAPEAEK